MSYLSKGSFYKTKMHKGEDPQTPLVFSPPPSPPSLFACFINATAVLFFIKVLAQAGLTE